MDEAYMNKEEFLEWAKNNALHCKHDIIRIYARGNSRDAIAEYILTEDHEKKNGNKI